MLNSIIQCNENANKPISARKHGKQPRIQVRQKLASSSRGGYVNKLQRHKTNGRRRLYSCRSKNPSPLRHPSYGHLRWQWQAAASNLSFYPSDEIWTRETLDERNRLLEHRAVNSFLFHPSYLPSTSYPFQILNVLFWSRRTLLREENLHSVLCVRGVFRQRVLWRTRQFR